MQTLSFLGAGRILTKWAAGLYRSIAAIYTDMLNLVDTFNDSPLAEKLNNISANVYVLVGVFMLFRIGVSLLNYLVDPSKLDDKKVGGGQLVTHILISIVLLLSLNFVFKWTNDLQTILLERDGILYKIISTGNAEMSKLNDLQLINTQEVSVVSKKYKDNENICNNTATIKAALKEHIINNIREGCFTKKYTRAEAEKLVNSVPITYNSSGRELTGISGSIDETSLKGLNTKVSVKYKNQVGQSVSGVKPNFHLTNATCYFNFPLSRDYSDNSLDSISGFHVEYYCDSSKSDEVEKSIEGIENKKEQQIRKDQGKYDNSSIEESGFEFATITLSTFMSPSDEVDDTILKQYSGEKSSDWWADQIEDEQKSSSGITYSMDWLLAFICGLAIIAVLLAIMIEVVVRNLKLVFLKAIAPIPVVSYMNPNDKLLGTWVKQYIGVYFSLFIQLFVILIIPDLMMKLLDSVTGGFILKIVIIAGCLLFTKEAPKFIGKLLGLDNMEGSFGDAFKMVKTGLGIGAGAAAAAVGSTIGGVQAFHATKGQSGWNRFAAGANAFGTGVSSIFKGASGGAKGKILEGSKHAKDISNKRRDMYEGGAAGGSVFLSGLLGNNYDPNRKDKRVESAYDDVLNARKAVDSRLEDEILKKNVAGLKQDRDNLALMRSTGKDINGNAVSTQDIANFEKNYVDKMNSTKATCVSEVLSGKKGIYEAAETDVQTKALIEAYDRKVDYYGKTLGKEVSTSDPDYSYNFEELQKFSNVEAGNADSYKATKSTAEDAKVRFSNSSTRSSHYEHANAK